MNCYGEMSVVMGEGRRRDLLRWRCMKLSQMAVKLSHGNWRQVSQVDEVRRTGERCDPCRGSLWWCCGG